MANTFDNERRRKALIYTTAICSLLLIAFFIISWNVAPPPPPVVQELIEINLGNNDEGLGDIQPLVKGEPSPEEVTKPEPTKANLVQETSPEETKIIPDENAPADAAPVDKPVTVKAPKKIINPIPVVKPTPKPTMPTTAAVVNTPKPKVAKVVMQGPGKGGGNGAVEDNGYTLHGKKIGGKGDAGIPTGNKDTYGNKTGGTKVGGPKVISGNRKVVNYYSFLGNLDKATINAVIKVSPEGVGTFMRIGQGSTTFGNEYASAIRGYLQSMKFDKAADESTVTVQFNFNVQ